MRASYPILFFSRADLYCHPLKQRNKLSLAANEKPFAIMSPLNVSIWVASTFIFYKVLGHYQTVSGKF